MYMYIHVYVHIHVLHMLQNIYVHVHTTCMYMGFYLLDRVRWLQSHPLPSWKIYIHFWRNLPKILESQALPPVYKKASIIPITVHVRVCT